MGQKMSHTTMTKDSQKVQIARPLGSENCTAACVQNQDLEVGFHENFQGTPKEYAEYVLKKDYSQTRRWSSTFVSMISSRATTQAKQRPRPCQKQLERDFSKRHKILKEKSSKVVKITKSHIGDLEIVKTLGSGSFGKVILVRSEIENCAYDVGKENCDEKYKYLSVKVMNKERLVELNQVDHVTAEKEILGSLCSPFIVSFFDSYKDNNSIFIVMEYLNGGELFIHLRKSKRFNESVSRFFASQVIFALEYLHSLSIIYRDLKPENIMMTSTGYIKITDFGFAKRIDGRTWTMCGTPEYLAPEIILNKGYNETVDYWALGILIYELNAGFPPFCDSSPMRIYEKILQGRMKLLPFFSNNLRKLIKCLLHNDVTCRMGNLVNGIKDLKEHDWFKDYILWDDIFDRLPKSLYQIKSLAPNDTSYFDDVSEHDLESGDECIFDGDFSQF